jgi:hypothetical protein
MGSITNAPVQLGPAGSKLGSMSMNISSVAYVSFVSNVILLSLYSVVSIFSP